MVETVGRKLHTSVLTPFFVTKKFATYKGNESTKVNTKMLSFQQKKQKMCRMFRNNL